MTRKHRLIVALSTLVLTVIIAILILKSIFLAIFSLFGQESSSNSQAVAESTVNPFSVMEENLIMSLDLYNNISTMLDVQIDGEADNFETFFADNYSQYITLDSIQYGYFTNSNYTEALAIFSSKQASHAEGLGRKIAAIYDVSTGKLQLQKTFSADELSIYVLKSSEVNYSCLLMTGYTTYDGNIYGTAEFGSVNGGVWNELTIPLSSSGENISYSYDEATQKLTATIVEVETEDESQSETNEFIYEFNHETLQFIEVTD